MLGDFRRPRTAAPLKHGRSSKAIVRTARFPPSSDGGPIEADAAALVQVTTSITFPPSSDGGPIEAGYENPQ